ncbi:Hypothetical predicted protein [Mytilus galloprovincialis]|uniref:Endonuclease/exonuclease/phosphatase domain-containing protein n=1 Tax=Mytilus galloprovincialis TaxID=29158 RepID=A0A8B6CFF3_MYTGA|nr:Hypothetical predicted protein [Mytilus galloprovincialis]
MVLLYNKSLQKHIEILKVSHDTVIWVKVDKTLFFDKSNDVYICFVYVPHENNIFYDKYDVDIYDCLTEDIASYSSLGPVAAIGDWNSRIGIKPDFIQNDELNITVKNTIDNFISYDSDDEEQVRFSEDKTVNNFGGKLLRLCQSTGLRVCNGRSISDKIGKLTFYNHLGSSVIDYALIHKNYLYLVNEFAVMDFNMWSDHAPVRLTLEIADTGIKTFNSSDDNIFHSTYRWDPDKITEMKTSLISHMDTMNSNVEQMVCTEQSIENTVIKFTETLNTVFKPFCEKHYCIKRNATNIKSNKNSLPNKPWFDDRCKELYIYHCNIRRFNRNRNNLNRQVLIESKKNYKSYENRVKRNYLRYEGNQIDYWRKHNPKQFLIYLKKERRTLIVI